MFSNSWLPIDFSYAINSIVLTSVVGNIQDLVFLFVPSFSPNAPIDYIICEIFKMLGFIKWIADEFELVTSLKSLYCALVMSILKYGLVVRNLYSAGDYHKFKLV